MTCPRGAKLRGFADCVKTTFYQWRSLENEANACLEALLVLEFNEVKRVFEKHIPVIAK